MPDGIPIIHGPGNEESIQRGPHYMVPDTMTTKVEEATTTTTTTDGRDSRSAEPRGTAASGNTPVCVPVDEVMKSLFTHIDKTAAVPRGTAGEAISVPGGTGTDLSAQAEPRGTAGPTAEPSSSSSALPAHRVVSAPVVQGTVVEPCLLYTSPSPRDRG